jgi:hypothetical protein
MFELNVVVASVVMFNILELIMEIVPNSPTSICGRQEKEEDGRMAEAGELKKQQNLVRA